MFSSNAEEGIFEGGVKCFDEFRGGPMSNEYDVACWMEKKLW